jgi:hypothetical protein
MNGGSLQKDHVCDRELRPLLGRALPVDAVYQMPVVVA